MSKTIYVVSWLSVIAALSACDRRSEMEPVAPTDTPPQTQAPQTQGTPAAEGRVAADPERAEPQQPAQGTAANQEAAQQGTAQQAGSNVRTVADITGSPQDFMGKQVTVRGAVEEIYQTRGFKLDDEAALKGGVDDDLIVVGLKDASWNVNAGWGKDAVQVTGTVRRVSVEELERDLGWEAKTELREALQGETVALVADNVQRTEER